MKEMSAAVLAACLLLTLASTLGVADPPFRREVEQGRSLYEAVLLEEASGVPVTDRIPLVVALAEVFEFKVDFTSEIQPGDSYRLVYERESRPDGTARGAPRILAAEITAGGQPYTGFLFALDNGRRDYYDAKGSPLQQGFTRYPIEFARITSSFNPRRRHPATWLARQTAKPCRERAPAGRSLREAAAGPGPAGPHDAPP